ncbi:hypothetical protein NDU88_002246, partial [Pleurodeles waltl]
TFQGNDQYPWTPLTATSVLLRTQRVDTIDIDCSEVLLTQFGGGKTLLSLRATVPLCTA